MRDERSSADAAGLAIDVLHCRSRRSERSRVALKVRQHEFGAIDIRAAGLLSAIDGARL